MEWTEQSIGCSSATIVKWLIAIDTTEVCVRSDPGVTSTGLLPTKKSTANIGIETHANIKVNVNNGLYKQCSNCRCFWSMWKSSLSQHLKRAHILPI